MTIPDLLPALLGFAFVGLATPGPNNMMLMASGANFGLRRSLPHILGITVGFGAMIVLLAVGIARVIAESALIADILRWISLVWMLWLAWKIANAPQPGARPDTATTRPMTFVEAAAFQWVNPKAWALALGALAVYAAGVGGGMVVAAVFTLVNLPSLCVWTLAGQGMRRFLNRPIRLRVFNITMAILLVASMLPAIFV